jgi:RNA polymerase sigma-70 factor (ECF subfamily)
VLEDRMLVFRLRHGSREALRRIYEKYRDDLLRIAAALLNQRSTAEDVVHDVFVNFVRSSRQFQLTGSLKAYLATCVANRARNVNRLVQNQKDVSLDQADLAIGKFTRPDKWIEYTEQFEQLSRALDELPYEQREAIVLHLQAGFKLREIATTQDVSIKTVQSRCRYALEKLRSSLDNEVEK